MRYAVDRLALLLGVLVLLGGCSLIGESFRVEGAAMEPTLKPGARIQVRKAAEYRRGDIIVFDDAKGRAVIKRVIGLPGESVELRAGAVHINGQALDEPYVEFRSTDSHPPTTVPADAYFVMGDNRPGSQDSRHVGTVPRSRVRGVAQ